MCIYVRVILCVYMLVRVYDQECVFQHVCVSVFVRVLVCMRASVHVHLFGCVCVSGANNHTLGRPHSS